MKKHIFTPKCDICGKEASRITVTVPSDDSEEYLTSYSGPGGGSNDTETDQVPAERIIAMFTEPYDLEAIQAEYYDNAGLCGECGVFYCQEHWNISDIEYGTCPKGHGKSIDPHWSPYD